MKLSEINTNNINNDVIKNIFFSIKKEDYEFADYLVIYGCHIKSLLDERLFHALKIIKEKNIKKIVLTGGTGIYGDFNESEYMLKFLLDNNISRNIILVDDKSTTTQENNINVVEMLDLNNINKPLNIVLVSQEFHLVRIILNLKKILVNNNIHFYYDYVDDTNISYDNVINNDSLLTTLKEQIEISKNLINDGIYEDIDIYDIKNL